MDCENVIIISVIGLLVLAVFGFGYLDGYRSLVTKIVVGIGWLFLTFNWWFNPLCDKWFK